MSVFTRTSLRSKHVLIVCLTVASLSTVGAVPSAHAELGDYSFWKTLRNLVKPQKPDNKVTSQDATGPYPLTQDRTAHDDGFREKRYLKWQTITIDPASGASCGNGSPYKIFVNRSPNTSNMLVYMEGGGACWDEPSCSGNLGKLSARNPNGIPDDYLKLKNPGASLVSPFVVRLHPWERVETQDWTLVYVPYCTGDIYIGDSIQQYEDPDGVDPDLTWHHNGFRNTTAAVSWIKNNLERPGQMLSTGCSAGGAGTLANYDMVRGNIDPTRAYMLNDSGPLFSAPTWGSNDVYPSIPLARTIRDAWGLDTSTTSPLGYLATRLPDFDVTDSGTMYRALSSQYPSDRMGHVHFWADLNYSRFSYERFYPEIEAAPSEAARNKLVTAKWGTDTEALRNELKNYGNFGSYFPNYRDLNDSHCATIVDFNRGKIEEDGLRLEDFIDDVINGNGRVMEATEDDRVSDQKKRRNLIYQLIDSIL